MKRKTVVPFRNKQGISPELVNKLTQKGNEYNINGIHPFPVQDIVVAEWVGLKCQYGCSRFNTSWCCPPATPDIDRVRKLLSEYNTALLLVGKNQCKDFHMNNAKQRANQIRYWKGTVGVERLLFLEGYYKAFSLVSGACSLCKECAYPDDCRFPKEKRPTIEAFSIDVIGTLQSLGFESMVATDESQSFDYYGLILLD